MVLDPRNNERQKNLISSLFEVLRSFDQTRLRKFLRFVTGSNQVPITGFRNNPIMITVLEREVNRFPRASTCFRTLTLWDYTS